MKNRPTLTILLLSLLFPLSSWSQCGCTDCPVNTVSNGTVQSVLNISGATNPTMGLGGQALSEICIDYFTDAVDEVDMILYAPDGSNISLILQTGISSNDGMTFQICLVANTCVAMPDPGFSAVFDSNEAWQTNTTYTGTYYPASGLDLASLTGPVNGNWVLEVTDFIGLDDGTINDWTLGFNDNSGLPCTTVSNCVPCFAEAGELSPPVFTECVGSANLNITPVVSYPTNPPADPMFHGYTYVVSDINTDVIISYTTTPDLSGFSVGSYQVCGVSYLLTDFSLLPGPNGTVTLQDLQDDIDSNSLCADISDTCIEVNILDVPAPVFTGPTEVCDGELVVYTLENPSPFEVYSYNILAGGFDLFSIVGNTVEVIWNAGPGEICLDATNICGTESVCVNVTVGNPVETIEITGPTEVCQDEVAFYAISPSLEIGETWIIDVTEGVVASENATSITILWSGVGTGELCVDVQTTNGCGPAESCINVNINPFEPPATLGTPLEMCPGDTAISSVLNDPNILSYAWTLTNLIEIQGNGTNEIEYTTDVPGLATVCLEIESVCGMEPIVCEDIMVEQIIEPIITPLNPTCLFSFTLDAIATAGSVIEWTQISGPPAVTIFNPDQLSTLVQVLVAGIYEFQISSTVNACTLTSSVVVVVYESPLITNEVFTCDANGDYTVSFSMSGGTPDYLVNGVPIIGGFYMGIPIPSGDNYSYIVEDVNGCSAEISGTHICACDSQAGEMASELLESCAEVGNSVTSVFLGGEFLDPDDAEIFVLHDGSGTTLGNVIEISSTGEFFYEVDIVPEQTYYISHVVGNEDGGVPDFDDICLDVSSGQPVVFYAIPSFDIEAQFTSCNLLTSVDFLDIQDAETLNWTVLSGPGNLQFDVTGFLTDFIADASGDYQVQFELTNKICVTTGIIDLSFSDDLQVLDIESVCDITQLNYTLSFNVEGGQEPFSANISGVFTGNSFVSDNLPSGDVTQVTITDDFNCTFSFDYGPVICDCTTDAGTMSDQLIEVCATEDASFASIFNGGAVLDIDDIGLFVLHDNAGNILGNIIDFNITGIFSYSTMINPGQTYYVSLVVGNEFNGFIDLDHPCTQVSQGQPVVFLPFPSGTIADSIVICELQAILEFADISNTNNISWNQISGPDFLNIDVLDFVTAVTATTSGEYLVEYTLSNNICNNVDSIRLFLSDDLVFSEIESICSFDQTEYVLSFEIEGGFPPFTNNVGGDIIGNVFTATLIPDSLYQITIVDALGCETIISNGPVLCDCDIEIGTYQTDTIFLCEDDALEFMLLNHENYLLDPESDTVAFAVYNDPGDAADSYIEISLGDAINQAGFNLDQLYYVRIIISSTIGINGTGINFDDPCLQLSEPIPIIWRSNYLFNFDVHPTVCVEDMFYEFDQLFPGPFPYNITFTSEDGIEEEYTISQENTTISLPIFSGGIAWAITDFSGSCQFTFNGNLTITGQDPQEFTLMSFDTICNNEIFGSIIQFENLVDNTVEGIWYLDGLEITGTSIDFDGFVEGDYTLTFSSEMSEAPCDGKAESFSFYIKECSCPVVNHPDLVEFCNTEGPIDMEGLFSANFAGDFQLLNPDNLSETPIIIPDNNLDISSATEGTYVIEFSLSDAWPSECELSYQVEIFIENQAFEGSLSLDNEFCAEDFSDIDLNDLLDDEDQGGQWSFNNSDVNSPFDISVLDTGLHVFTYLLSETANCDEATIDVNLKKLPHPEAIALAEDVLCFGQNDGTFTVEIVSDSYGPYTCDFQGNDVGKTIENLPPGNYSVLVTNANGCSTEITDIIINEPEVLNVSLGGDQEVNYNDMLTVEAIINLLQSDIDSIAWSDLDGLIDDDDLILVLNALMNNTITIVITDENGCIAIDEISIRLTEESVYLPNILLPESNIAENRRFGVYANDLITNVQEFSIYDRWGNQVFTAKDVLPGSDEAFWDGQFNEKNVQTGVYAYYIRYETVFNTEELIKGDITVVY